MVLLRRCHLTLCRPLATRTVFTDTGMDMKHERERVTFKLYLQV